MRMRTRLSALMITVALVGITPPGFAQTASPPAAEDQNHSAHHPAASAAPAAAPAQPSGTPAGSAQSGQTGQSGGMMGQGMMGQGGMMGSGMMGQGGAAGTAGQSGAGAMMGQSCMGGTASQSGATGMMCMRDMMSMMRSMMTMMGAQSGMTASNVEGRIAALKTELKITEAQTSAWNKFAEAMRATAGSMNGMYEQMTQSGPAATLPARLERREALLSAHLNRVKSLREALEPLYASFSDEQKKTANGMMIGPMGMM